MEKQKGSKYIKVMKWVLSILAVVLIALIVSIIFFNADDDRRLRDANGTWRPCPGINEPEVYIDTTWFTYDMTNGEWKLYANSNEPAREGTSLAVGDNGLFVLYDEGGDEIGWFYPVERWGRTYTTCVVNIDGEMSTYAKTSSEGTEIVDSNYGN